MARVNDAVVALAMLALAGCVTVPETRRWSPQDEGLEQAHTTCMRETQSADGRALFNPPPYHACMNARGYTVVGSAGRKEFHPVAQILLLPILIPLYILAAFSGFLK